MKTKLLAAVGLAVSMSTLPVTAQAGRTLDAIKQRNTINCGVNTGRAGFAIVGANGEWRGLDVDYCRALAAAVLGDAGRVRFVPVSTQTRFTALQSGEIDVLARNTTWMLSRDASLGLHWVGVNFYDGQAFLVRKMPGLDSAKKLNGATVCLSAGSTTEKTLADYFRANRMTYRSVVLENADAAIKAFEAGRCQVYSNDFASLAVVRATELARPDDFAILPEIVTKEPLGPAVRRGDDEWFAIARWTLHAMIEAEELGLSQANVETLRATSESPEIRRFVGLGEDLGRHLGLDKDWAYRIVRQVGNYGDSFERNLGPNTPIGLQRGLMRLWTDGGLLYAPPLR